MKKVMAGGTFSILHPGHVQFLRKAKSLGDCLVVVIAHDSTVLRNKGVLLAPAGDRKRLVESIRFVDKVVIGRKDDFLRVVESERPDVIALGYDQHRDMEWLLKRLGKNVSKPRIVTIKRFGNYSTKQIMEKYKREAGR